MKHPDRITYSAHSTGYTVFYMGQPIGGHTTGNKPPRDGAHRRALGAMHTRMAEDIVAALKRDQGPPYMHMAMGQIDNAPEAQPETTKD